MVCVFVLTDDCREHLVQVDGYAANGNATKPKFHITNLTKFSDDGVPILKGIHLDIPKGVIVGVIGPSGSGKSTLLRALNRLWEPPSASVFLDARDICHLDVLSLRRKVGMLFQLPALFEGLTLTQHSSFQFQFQFLYMIGPGTEFVRLN